MDETEEAVCELIAAALAWHDVEFGAPGEMEATLNLSAVLNTYRPVLEQYLSEISEAYAGRGDD